jgi:hypothetical protein
MKKREKIEYHYDDLELVIWKLKNNEIDPTEAACILEDFLADLTRGRGRPKHDWYAKEHNPIRRDTKKQVEAEEKRLRAETGKTRVKSQAVNNVAKNLNLSRDAIWRRIRQIKELI